MTRSPGQTSVAVTIRNFYSLTKPGVLYGNALSAAAGLLYAERGHFSSPWLIITALLGISLVIASACVINNYLDQDIDRLMTRTKNRALVNGSVRGRDAVSFGVVLGLLGAGLLLLYSNLLTLVVVLVGFVDYLVLYGMWSKRTSWHGTVVGAISGAAPILAGYTAVTGHIDLPATLIFLAIFLWQMPEFYSIAIYRRAEYQVAGVPVISVVKGVRYTKVQILLYTIAFVVVTLALAAVGAASLTYALCMLALGVYWIWLGWQGLLATSGDAWARRMFHASLVVLLAFSALISLDAWLP